jgi:hypothetical protein
LPEKALGPVQLDTGLVNDALELRAFPQPFIDGIEGLPRNRFWNSSGLAADLH